MRLPPTLCAWLLSAAVLSAAEPNTSSHWNWHAVNNQSRIPDCEGIEGIRDWHTNPNGTKEGFSARRMKCAYMICEGQRRYH